MQIIMGWIRILIVTFQYLVFLSFVKKKGLFSHSFSFC